MTRDPTTRPATATHSTETEASSGPADGRAPGTAGGAASDADDGRAPDAVGGRAPDTDDGRAPDAVGGGAPDAGEATTGSTPAAPASRSRVAGTRREVLRTVGATVGVGAVGGAAALPAGAQEDDLAPWTVETYQVEDWSFETSSAGSPPADTSTTVSVEDDRVVVSGTYEFGRTGCDGVAPRLLRYSEQDEILGVVIDSFETHELDPEVEPGDLACAGAVSYVSFELEVVLAGDVAVVGVDAPGAMDDRTLHAPDGWPGVDLPPEFADYEFTVGSTADLDEAPETPPSITVEEERVVVEGAIRYASSTCHVVDLLDAESVEPQPRHARFVVGPRPTEEAIPTGACSDDVLAREYELVLTPAEDVRLDWVTVEERHSSGDTTETTAEVGASEWPAGVADVEFEAGHDLHGVVDEPPYPSVEWEDDAVVVRSDGHFFEPACDSLELASLEFASLSADHLAVTVSQDAEAPADEDCADQPEYVLRVTFEDDLPRSLTVVEDGAQSEGRYASTRDWLDLEAPDGVADYEFVRDPEDPPVDDHEAAPVARVEGDEVVVDGHVGVGTPCQTAELTGLDLADGELSVEVENVYEPGETPFTGCDDVLETERYRVRVSFADGLPDVVRAVEDGATATRSTSLLVEQGVELPPGVVDADLEIGEGEFGDEESPPSVSVEPDADEPRVVVEGAVRHPESCYQPRLREVRWEDEPGGHLAAWVVEERLEHAGCLAAEYVATYRLELTLASLPETVTAEERVADGEPVRSNTRVVGGCARPATVDGGTVCDLDGDGLYRDVTGDGTLGQDDVVHFFENQHRDAWQQPDRFDFSENGAVGHGDVVALFEAVATS